MTVAKSYVALVGAGHLRGLPCDSTQDGMWVVDIVAAPGDVLVWADQGDRGFKVASAVVAGGVESPQWDAEGHGSSGQLAGGGGGKVAD